MGKRSPRYPRVELKKAIDMVRRLYEGVHQSKVDADSAAQVIGYSNSSSGAAAGALGALRQYGLVDGLRGDVAVSDLAMRILQPMNENEHIEAVHEAANKPEVFSHILQQFGGEPPKSDAPILAFLVRQQGFSQSGASEVTDIFRSTFSGLPELSMDAVTQLDTPSIEGDDIQDEPQYAANSASPVNTKVGSGEVIALPLGPDCRAEIHFTGKVSAKSYDILIRFLTLMKDTASD